MGNIATAAKKVTRVAEKAVKETIKDPVKKAYKGLVEEPLEAGLELTGKAVGKVAEGMVGDAPEADTSAQDDLMRRQGEDRMSQESELAKRKALRKKGAKGRGSLLSGSALGVTDTLG
jgi:hypothetical protein